MVKRDVIVHASMQLINKGSTKPFQKFFRHSNPKLNLPTLEKSPLENINKSTRATLQETK